MNNAAQRKYVSFAIEFNPLSFLSSKDFWRNITGRSALLKDVSLLIDPRCQSRKVRTLFHLN
jgi:hypothetical protein